MNIKQIVRKALLTEAEKKDHKREFGCLMVFLDVDTQKWKELQDMIKEEDLYTEEGDDGYGREKDPHVTILYGLHEEIKDSEIEKDINEIKKPKIEFKNISAFENDYDVLKFDVKSEDLTKLNKIFTEYPHTNKFPDYHPHCTMCYVKKGKAAEYEKSLNEFIKNNDLNIKPSKLVYSKVNGTKKEYPFN